MISMLKRKFSLIFLKTGTSRNLRGIKKNLQAHCNADRISGDFQNKVTPRIDRRNFVFNGSVGEAMASFIEYKRIEQRLSQVHILCYKRYLFRFLHNCNKKGIRTINKIGLPFIFHFIADLDVGKENLYIR
jgi:hypothetical protein